LQRLRIRKIAHTRSTSGSAKHSLGGREDGVEMGDGVEMWEGRGGGGGIRG
jgi:hypothetical protein